ncbi:MAG: methyltransferase [Saprospiraceae bacterium]
MPHPDPELIFTWNGISICQQKDVFKIGTDALLLGAWIPKIICSPSRILDVGTGTGIITLMMAQYFTDASMTGIDTDMAAVSLSAFNFQHSNWAERLIAKQENILEHPAAMRQTYDLIVSNPPFYFNKLNAGSEIKSKAKHADASVDQWIEGILLRLHSSGHVCVIVPFHAAYDWIRAANNHGMYCLDRLNVYSFIDDTEPVRTLLHFHAELNFSKVSRLIIYTEESNYTQEYIDMVKIVPGRGK